MKCDKLFFRPSLIIGLCGFVMLSIFGGIVLYACRSNRLKCQRRRSTHIQANTALSNNGPFQNQRYPGFHRLVNQIYMIPPETQQNRETHQGASNPVHFVARPGIWYTRNCPLKNHYKILNRSRHFIDEVNNGFSF